ncbi:MAG: hypothetical protein ABFS39_09850 [Pseudomonadota bacterium]
MSKQKLIIYSAMLAIGGSNLAVVPGAYAFDMGNMMNPSKWMGGKNRDRYDDDYYYDRGRYGYGGPYGGYGGPYGGYGGPYGYGGYPGYGYGAPGYGYGAPGYQQQQNNQPPPPPLPQ